jgi:hypothetical protein
VQQNFGKEARGEEKNYPHSLFDEKGGRELPHSSLEKTCNKMELRGIEELPAFLV